MKRFFPILLVLMLFMPVSAAEIAPVDVLYDTASVSRWNAYFEDKPFGELSVSEGWQLLDGPVRVAGIGALDSHATLERRLLAFERKYAEVRNGILQTFVNVFLDVDAVRAVIDFDGSLGAYRMKDERSGIWIVSPDGSFPYYSPDSSVDPDTGETSVSLGGQWVPYSQIDWTKTNVLTEYSLYDIGYALRDIGQDNDITSYSKDGAPRYKYIRSAWTSGAVGDYYVYCDGSGYPYVSRVEADEWAQEQDNNWIIDDDGNTESGQLIDVDTSTIWFPDGTLNFINNLVYDESQKTYYVDASSSYDIDNNYYYHYEWHYTYHIDYTSITYIGQTAEYDEVYEYYYQLPDGRSSADLTAEELQALNTQIDVLPYIRSADDTSIRALYHFDGDIRDSSYWSHLGHFDWQKGASITYMDAGAFGGALYLDENEHEFSIKLPSNIGSGDFTLQFRLYISATPAPVNDSYFEIGSAKLGFTGQSIVDSGGRVLAPLSNGSWQEICLMRSGTSLLLFHNGVVVKNWPNFTTALPDIVNFSWGDEQQTFKYFDELRVVNKAVYPVTGYTVSSVPFDTNLALVLPDTQVPVADEYWDFNSTYDNLLEPLGLDNWITFVSSPRLTDYQSSNSYYQTAPYYQSGTGWTNFTSSNYPYFTYYGDVTSLTSFETGTSLYSPAFVSNGMTLDPYSTVEGGGSGVRRITGGIFSLLCSVRRYDPSSNVYHLPSGTYTFSMVAADGDVGTVTFTLPPEGQYSNAQSTLIEFNGYYIGCRFGLGTSASGDTDYWYLVVQPIDNQRGGEFVYLQLVEGDTTDLTAEFVSSVVVMDKDDLHTPSLAVRTDLDITGYQIGGVRPSLPDKGMVWAMVENGRITSLQVYNGQAWEEVDGRIWTGSRWVPYYAYDVLLLKDMWDIVEADPTLNPIYTETGFWTWFQSAWKDMIARLDKLISLGGSGGGGVALPPDASTQFPGAEDDPTTDENEGWTVIDLAVTLKDGVWSIVKGVVKVGVGGFSGLVKGVTTIGGFFDAYDENGIFQIMNESGGLAWE